VLWQGLIASQAYETRAAGGRRLVCGRSFGQRKNHGGRCRGRLRLTQHGELYAIDKECLALLVETTRKLSQEYGPCFNGEAGIPTAVFSGAVDLMWFSEIHPGSV